MDFGVLHDVLGLSETAAEWLRRNAHNLPQEVRAEEADRSAFASLFASYITTSYILLPTVRYRSRNGCSCAFCARLSSASTLTVRQPDKKAKERARDMKQLYVSGLVTELGGTLRYGAIAELITDPTLAPHVSYATYGHELLRRARFASQGEGVLVLWREIAWEQGRLRKNFILSADSILQGEAAIVEAIIAAHE